MTVGQRIGGVVKWWSSERGYGFVSGEDQVDYFAHYKEIQGEGRRDLQEGGKVEFEIGTTPKGPAAKQIVIQ